MTATLQKIDVTGVRLPNWLLSFMQPTQIRNCFYHQHAAVFFVMVDPRWFHGPSQVLQIAAGDKLQRINIPYSLISTY